MAKKNIKLIIEYQGTNIFGWQSQAEGRTVQGEIISAIEKITGQNVKLTGAGRTDSGVHALGQVANFEIDHSIEPDKFKEAINHFLSDDILIKSSGEVDPSFDSRRSARYRKYRYIISTEKSVIYKNLRWETTNQLDISLLNKSASALLGEHDFSPFCVTASLKENNNCTIYEAKWTDSDNQLIFDICGNRFLHSMVRSLVGAMVNLATEKSDKNLRNLTLEKFQDIINLKNDERISFTAPACGLYLVSVGYDEF